MCKLKYPGGVGVKNKKNEQFRQNGGKIVQFGEKIAPKPPILAGFKGGLKIRFSRRYPLPPCAHVLYGVSHKENFLRKFQKVEFFSLNNFHREREKTSLPFIPSPLKCSTVQSYECITGMANQIDHQPFETCLCADLSKKVIKMNVSITAFLNICTTYCKIFALWYPRCHIRFYLLM